MILTGTMNRKGGAWFHPGFITQFEQLPSCPCSQNPGPPAPPTRPDVSGIVGDWPCAVLPAEIEAGNIRALFNFGGSIVRSFPDTNALVAALQKLELHVITEIVENDTDRHSAPMSCRPRTPSSGPRSSRWDTLAWNVSMQYTPPLVKPMGERRSAWWVISQIMRRADLPRAGPRA